jgi:hypothetical protein
VMPENPKWEGIPDLMSDCLPIGKPLQLTFVRGR